MQHVIKSRGMLRQDTIGALMEALSMQRPMLVCGCRMAQTFAERVGMALPVFSGYHPNPDLSDCEAGVALYRDRGCDGLISLGGGSAMDTAKGIKALLLTSDMDAVKRSDLLNDTWLPHIAIPGTAGTGAEATPIAVVYVDDDKLSLDHPVLLPEAVVLDSSLLDTLPDYHRKACAMDALAQGIESYWAQKATAESRCHAEKAIRGVLRNLTAYLAGDVSAQDAMLEAAYESGCAIRISRTTAAHAMSYQITKRLGYAHGHACMLTLPHLWARMEQNETLAALAKVMGVAQEDAPAYLTGMLAAMDMLPDGLPDDATLDALVASVNTQRLGNHPEALTSDDLRAVYIAALRPMDEAERERALALWRKYDG